MESSQRVTVGGAVLLGVIVGILLLGPAPGVAAQENATSTANATTSTANATTSTANAIFGAQVSAYMQSTAADANGSVDRGMWAERASNASNPGEVVSERARELERRVDRLETESADLAAAANASDAADVVYTGRASAVRAELANLRQSLDQTAATAANSGVDDERLTAVRERAGNVSGPDVPANARGVTSDDRGPPEWVPGGPDGDTGPAGETPGADPGNGSRGGGPGDAGPPTDRGSAGPPDDPGSGNAADTGGGGGPSDEGNGNPPDGAGTGGSSSGPGNSGNVGSEGNAGTGGGPSGNAGGGPEPGADSDTGGEPGAGGQANRP